MQTASDYVDQLSGCPRIDTDRIRKLAADGVAIYKEAARNPLHKKVLSFLVEGVKASRGKAGIAAVGMVGTAGLAGGVKLVNEIKYRGALADLKKDPEVQADQERAMQIAGVVKKWAPSVASDPTIFKGTVKSLMKFPDSYLTHDIAKKLSETEKEYMATHGLLSLLQQRLI